MKKFRVVPTLRLCVLYGSQNKQQLLPYKTLRDWFFYIHYPSWLCMIYISKDSQTAKQFTVG
jgi:hypothetical protein